MRIIRIWVQVDFGTNRTLTEIDVFTLQDNYAGSSEPTESMTFTQWGLTGYEVQYWSGSNWLTVSGGSVTGNNKIWRKFTFSPITTSKIRVLTNASPDGYSRLTEIEAYGPAEAGASGGVQWLISDHLGTPRMVLDQTGNLNTMKRHDYLPFGEELVAPTGGRSAAEGYAGGDGVRQQFTSKERDTETGLDYFGYRYFSPVEGRFVSVDPIAVTTENFVNPQRWNPYAYVNNNPLSSQDPDGAQGKGKGGDKTISVFLDQHLKPEGSREPRVNAKTKEVLGYENPWRDVNGSKQYSVQLYGSAEMTGVTNMPAASYNFEAALQNSELVVYVGHGAGLNFPGSDEKPFEQQGIVMDSAFYQSDGNHLLIDGAQSGITLPKPTVTSKVVVNFSCDAIRQGGTYFNFTGKGQVMITINGGKNGITNTATLEKAAAAFVKTYVATKGDYAEAAKAANKVIAESVQKYPANRGDAVDVKPAN